MFKGAILVPALAATIGLSSLVTPVQATTATDGTGQPPEASLVITDEGGFPFRSKYLQLGGSDTLGEPISDRFEWRGLTCQLTTNALLHWDHVAGEVRVANSLDIMSAAGLDRWLNESWGIPPLGAFEGEPGLGEDPLVDRRMGVLDGHPALRSAYHLGPAALDLYGLPTSSAHEINGKIVVRLQRGALFQSPDSTVAAAPTGAILARSGLLPSAATVNPDQPVTFRAITSTRGGARSNAFDGIATWYGVYFQGRPMANGAPYNMWDPGTTASNIFPMGTLLRVTRRDTGAHILVRVTDRGAFQHPIVVDLSYAAFSQLGDPAQGVIPVSVEPVS